MLSSIQHPAEWTELGISPSAGERDVEILQPLVGFQLCGVQIPHPQLHIGKPSKDKNQRTSTESGFMVFNSASSFSRSAVITDEV